MADPEPGGTRIEVLVEGSGWAGLDFDAAAVARRAADAALSAVSAGAQHAAATETCILLADDGRLADLNRDWRGRDGPTNVLSFPGSDAAPPGMPAQLGDIAISCETVLREAADAGIPAEHHLSHMVVHGVLHLLGYDHEADGEAELMERRESEILETLGIPDPYAMPAEAGAGQRGGP